MEAKKLAYPLHLTGTAHLLYKVLWGWQTKGARLDAEIPPHCCSIVIDLGLQGKGGSQKFCCLLLLVLHFQVDSRLESFSLFK